MTPRTSRNSDTGGAHKLDRHKALAVSLPCGDDDEMMMAVISVARTSDIFPDQLQVGVWLREIGQLPHTQGMAILKCPAAQKLRLDRGSGDRGLEIQVIGGHHALACGVDGKAVGVEPGWGCPRQLDCRGKVAKQPDHAAGRAAVGVAHLADPKAAIWLCVERVSCRAVKEWSIMLNR